MTDDGSKLIDLIREHGPDKGIALGDTTTITTKKLVGSGVIVALFTAVLHAGIVIQVVRQGHETDLDQERRIRVLEKVVNTDVAEMRTDIRWLREYLERQEASTP